MADPTVSAYNKVNRLGTPRPSLPTSPVVTGFDISLDDDYYNQFPIWTKLRDCYDGEEVIKQAAERYLPKLHAHGPSEYEAYKNRAYFYNGVERTHRGLLGSLFRKPTEFGMPDNLRSKINVDRITLDGQSLEMFDKAVAHEILLVGRHGILADFKDNNSNNPYLVGYTAENIISRRWLDWQGRKIVDRIVLTEFETENTEFGSTSTPIIRILRLDPRNDGGGTKLVYSQTVLRPAATGPSMRSEVEINVNGRTFGYIPFVFVNTTNLRPDVQAAPLQHIAGINISHYQSTAHLEHGRFYAGMPTYVTSGPGGGAADLMRAAGQAANSGDPLATADALVVGPSHVWELPENSKAWLLEFNGHGLVFLENAVDSKQLQMQSLGGRLISSTRRAAAMSDEAWRLLESGDEATLMDVAITLDHAFNLALAFLGDMRGVIDDPFAESKNKIVTEHNKEFTPSELTARELRALQSLAERGHIPLDVMYYSLREVGVVPVEYSLEDFKALLEKQKQIWTPPPARDPITGEILPLPPQPTPGQPGVRPQPAPRPASGNNPPSGSSD